MTAKVSPLVGQVLRKAELTDYAKTVEGSAGSPVASAEDATVITSEVADTACFGGLHRPVLDIDMPVKVLPSSTPGHHHLLIDKEMTWQQYAYLLDALVAVGLIEPGYRDASVERGWSCVRLPWVRKNDPTNTPFVTNGDSWNGDDAFVMTAPTRERGYKRSLP